MKHIISLILVFTSILSFAQKTIKVKVAEIKTLNATNCDGTSANSDFTFEYKVTDNSPYVYSNNSPVAGLLGNCNYAYLENNDGPYTITPSLPNGAILNPSNGVFFDRSYNCENEIPTQLTIQWTAYENDDTQYPATNTGNVEGQTNVSTNTYTINPVSGTYAVQYTANSSNGGCSQSYEITFDVIVSTGSFSPLTIINAVGRPSCYQQNNGEIDASIVGGSGTILYDWSVDGVTDFDDSTNMYPISLGTYTLIVKDGLNCTDTAIVNVLEYQPIQAPTLFTASSSTVCSGTQNVAYAVNGSASFGHYIWSYSGSGALINGNTSSVTIDFSQGATSGTLSVHAFNDCEGASSSISMPITVVTSPSVTISGNSAVCSGNALTLTANGATSYTWTTGANTNTTVITPTSSATYTVTGGQANCTNTKTISIAVIPTPTVSISASILNVCPSETVALTANGNANLWIWSTGTVANTTTVSPTITTKYTLTGTSTNGCFKQDTLTVFVKPTPSVTFSGNTTICLGKTTTITATGADSYVWSNGMNGNIVTLSPSENSVYTVNFTNTITTCSGTQTLSIVVNAKPIMSISSNTNTICQGQSVELSAGGADFYSWSTGATANTETITPTSSTTVQVVGTTVNNCKDSITYAITVHTTPTVQITGVDSICSGLTTILTASGTGSFTWNTGATTPTISVGPATSTVYSITTISNGCSSSGTYTLGVKQTPTVTLSAAQTNVCPEDGQIILTGTPSGGLYSGTAVTANSFDPMVAGSGTYPLSYSYTAPNSCVASNSVIITVSNCSGVEENEATNSPILLYPNPSTGLFNIKTELPTHQIVIINTIGEIVKQYNYTNDQSFIDLTEFSKGIYFIKGISLDSSLLYQVKVIKE